MPTIRSIENKIRRTEGFDVVLLYNGRDARSDLVLQTQYEALRMTRNSFTVSDFRDKLGRQFPGFSFRLLKADGSTAPGQMLLSTLRDTYLQE